MSAEDDKGRKADPVEDLKKGLGLLFRAAKGAVDQLPTDKLEDAVKTGAREVGRAIENVTETIEKEVFGIPAKKKASGPPPASPPAATSGSNDAANAAPPAAPPQGSGDGTNGHGPGDAGTGTGTSAGTGGTGNSG